MLTDEQIADLDAAEKKATPGPWKGSVVGIEAAQDFIAKAYDDPKWRNGQVEDNTEFIALSRNHMRGLLDEVKAYREHVLECSDLSPQSGVPIEMWEENEKLRIELQAARDALKVVVECFRRCEAEMNDYTQSSSETCGKMWAHVYGALVRVRKGEG